MGNQPFLLTSGRRTVDTLQRLKRKTIIDENTGCWIFTGRAGNGIYAQIYHLGMMFTVHRVSAHIHLGLDLKDKESFACHKDICPNKKCWNPEHLYIGSRSDNAKDVWKERRNANLK